MMTVTQFAEFLLQRDPKSNLGRMAFYHFIKNFHSLGQPVTESMIQDFFDFIMVFNHWQGHKAELALTVREDLSTLTETQATPPLDHSKLQFPDEMQIVELQYQSDIKYCLESSLKAEFSGDHEIKIIPIENHKYLAAVLRPEGGLVSRVYGKAFKIHNTKIKPLAPLCDLIYNDRLDLIANRTHRLDTGMLNTILFQIQDGKVFGMNLRGYTLQKYETYSGVSMSQISEAFMKLKQMEKYYIDPQSDPYYSELVNLLQKANQYMVEGQPEGLQLAQAALQRGRPALKNLFPNDKLLLLLVNNLEYKMAQTQRPLSKDKTEETWETLKPLN